MYPTDSNVVVLKGVLDDGANRASCKQEMSLHPLIAGNLLDELRHDIATKKHKLKYLEVGNALMIVLDGGELEDMSKSLNKLTVPE